MTNERVWEARVRPMDDDGTAAEFGWGTEVQLLDSGELHVTVSNLTPESSAALAAQVNGSAAPSEGDGRRRSEELAAVYRDGHRSGWDDREAQMSGATPADPLPPGVHRAPDGTLLCKGDGLLSLPAGWQFRNMSGASWTLCSKFGSPSYGHSFFAVRPVPPVPEPEKVRWQDAIGRVLPDGREITGAWQGEVSTWISVDKCAQGNLKPDADGLVSVLPLGDPK